MPELNDHELLSEFVSNNSDAAFATLVERYVNLVYSAALRFTGDSHQADEITQVVFIVFSQKATSLSRRTVISGWLYQTTRLTAANFIKSKIRRQKREQEAYMLSALNEPQSPSWERIAPLLDNAMGDLVEKDRNAVVMRYFENKTASEIAQALQTTEAAAQKRVNRALEKLRRIFERKGVVLSSVAIGSFLSANSIQAAPFQLASTVAAITIKGAAIPAATTAMVNGTMKALAWLKLNFAIGVAVVAMVSIGITAIVLSISNRAGTYSKTEIEAEGTLRFSRSAVGRTLASEQNFSFRYRKSGTKWDLYLEEIGSRQNPNLLSEELIFDGQDLYSLTRLSKHLVLPKNAPQGVASENEPVPDLFVGIRNGVDVTQFMGLESRILWLAFRSGEYLTTETNEIPCLQSGTMQQSDPPCRDFELFDDPQRLLKAANFSGSSNFVGFGKIGDVRIMYKPPYDTLPWLALTYRVDQTMNVNGGSFPTRFVAHFNSVIPEEMTVLKKQEFAETMIVTGNIQKVASRLSQPIEMPAMPDSVNVSDVRFYQNQQGGFEWAASGNSLLPIRYVLNKSDKWPTRNNPEPLPKNGLSD